MAIDYGLAQLGSTAIQAVGNMITSGMSGHQARKTARMQNAWNLEQWYREIAKQEEWRDNERLYNSPESVVSRMKEAGINPAFALGQINGQMATPNVPKGADAVGYVPPVPNLGEIGAGISKGIMNFFAVKHQEQDLKMKNQQYMTGKYDLLFKGLEKLTQVNEMLSRAHLNKTTRNKVQRELDLFNETFDTQVGLAQEEYKNIIADTARIEAETGVYNAQQKWYDAQTNLTDKKAKLTDAQISEVYMNIRVMAQEIVESMSRVEYNKALTDLTYQKDLTERVLRQSGHLSNIQIEQNLPFVQDVLRSEIELNGAKKFGAYAGAAGTAVGATVGGIVAGKGMRSPKSIKGFGN